MDEQRLPEIAAEIGGVYVFASMPVLVTEPEAKLLLRVISLWRDLPQKGIPYLEDVQQFEYWVPVPDPAEPGMCSWEGTEAEATDVNELIVRTAPLAGTNELLWVYWGHADKHKLVLLSVAFIADVCDAIGGNPKWRRLRGLGLDPMLASDVSWAHFLQCFREIFLPKFEAWASVIERRNLLWHVWHGIVLPTLTEHFYE